MNRVHACFLVIGIGTFVGGCAVPRNEADVSRSSLNQEGTVQAPESRLLGIDERSRQIERNVGVR